MNKAEVKLGPNNRSGAWISDCEKYRYKLWRIWDNEKPKLLFIMLNPSKADWLNNDPTITRCIGFAKSNGYGGIYVGNLFALRATKPKDLWTELRKGSDCTGPENVLRVIEMSSECSAVAVAYGNLPNRARGQEKWIHELLPDTVCLGTCESGDPRHPLFVAGATKFVSFNPLNNGKV